MDLEQKNSLAKLPLLKQGEYDTWRLRIESYIQLQDYSLWEIIEEGNSFKPVAQTTREHLLTFNKHKDDKSLFEAIEARFGGNEATKKTQKTLLKQMYETLSASSSESLDSIFNRLQKIMSQLTILGHSSTNDGNTANVHVSTSSSLVSTASTNNSTVCLSDATVYAYLATQPNRSQVVHEDLDQIHEDDLDEMDLKWQLALLRHFARECINPKSQENRSRNQDSSRRTGNVEEASPKAMLAIDDLKTQYDKLRVELRKSESDLSNYKRGLASVEERLVFYKKNESMLNDQIAVLKRDASYKDSDINGLEKQVERLKKEKEENQFKIDNYENASKSLEQLIANQISDNNKKGLGYNVVPPPLTGLFAPPSVDLSSSGIEKFKEPEFEGYGVKVTKSASENVSKEVKKTSDAPIIEDWVSDCDEDETVVLESLNVQKPKQADQPRKVSQNPRNNSTSWNTPKPKKLGVGFQFTPKACFVCGSFNHLIKDCDFHDKKMVQKPVLNNVKKVTGQREVRPVWTNAMRVNHQNFSNSRRNFAPTAVLTKSGLIPFSTARQSFSRTAAPVSAARPFNTAVHKPFVNIAKPRTNAFQKSHSSLRRPFYQQIALKNRNLNNKVNTAKVISVNTVKGKRMTSVVGEQGINVVKPTAYWAWRPKIKMINHVSKNTGSCICKQFNYVDPTGRNKVLNSPYFMVKSWLVQDQTVLALAIPGQTATGKESSNPFMAGSLPKTIKAKDSEVCKITRADGTSSLHGDFQALLRRLDRQDLFQLYSLVQERYKHRSIKGHDLDLWGDLKMMFDPNEEDDIWLNQHYWELLRWKLHEYSGVHSLFLDGTSIQINMLVDKKYPLKKEILKKMINLKIKAEEES
ncbi:hypothetical protein Tco_0659827 [Tanacetum coccineum]